MPSGPLSKVVSGAKVTTASSSLLPSSPLGPVIATWPRHRHLAPSSPLGPVIATWPRHRHLAPSSPVPPLSLGPRHTVPQATSLYPVPGEEFLCGSHSHRVW